MDAIMNPLMKKYLGSAVRALLYTIVPIMVSRGIWTSDEATEAVAAIGAALTAFLWSAYEKHQARQKLLTAAASSKPVSEKEVEAKVKAGQAPPATLPSTVRPYLNTPPSSDPPTTPTAAA